MAERLLVRDLMTVGVATCSPETPVADIARLLLDKGLEGLVVLDQEGFAAGVVSQDELVRAYTRDDCRSLTAEAIMREGVPQIRPDIPLTAAAQLMQDQGVRMLFLMHEAGGITYPAAVLSYRHILRHLAARSDDELRDLGIAAARQAPLDKFIQKRDAARRRGRSP
jgi:CBS domain-containing protein